MFNAHPHLTHSIWNVSLQSSPTRCPVERPAGRAITIAGRKRAHPCSLNIPIAIVRRVLVHLGHRAQALLALFVRIAQIPDRTVGAQAELGGNLNTVSFTAALL